MRTHGVLLARHIALAGTVPPGRHGLFRDEGLLYETDMPYAYYEKQRELADGPRYEKSKKAEAESEAALRRSSALAGVKIDKWSHGDDAVETLRDALVRNCGRVRDVFHTWDQDASGWIDSAEFHPQTPHMAHSRTVAPPTRCTGC